jgi:hypothetical protein
MSTAAPSIWDAAVADAAGRAVANNASPGGGNIWQTAMADALGQRAPLPAGSFQVRKGGPVIQPGQGVQTADTGQRVVTPLPGESFADTMNRGAAMGRTTTPQEIQQATSTAAREAPLALAAGPAIAAAQLAIPTAAGEVFGPSTVSAPARDALGRFISGTIPAEGPSLASTGMNAVLNLVKSHPIISTYVGTHLANELGIPLPKVLKALAGIREVGPAE